MIARIHTAAFQGLAARPVDVQVHIGSGLPSFTIVGLPDKAVAESRERVRAALSAIGLGLPPKRLTVNLAPADLPKEGSHFDLPIALGLLAAMEVIPAAQLSRRMALGELGLDGSLAAVPGALPAAMAAFDLGLDFVCPESCGAEAAWSGLGERDGLIAPASLLQAVNHFKGRQILSPPARGAVEESDAPAQELRAVRRQHSAKRALEIAAAGGHNMLMIGPPGAGKSMLAACLPGLLPPLTPREALQTAMIASLAGEMSGGVLKRGRAFRAPHHSASMAAMIGGGPLARPGEVALAHRGVLFLDELPEFPRAVLDALRQPLETGLAAVARARMHITYPARFQLVAAMNPCRCGYAGDPSRHCGRVPRCARDYQARLSGPLLDRIDLVIEVPPVPPDALTLPADGESSRQVAERVAAARARQAARHPQGEEAQGFLNADIDSESLAEAGPARAPLSELAEQARKMGLTARGMHRVLRVARTIADLEGIARPGPEELKNALAYRRLPALGGMAA